MVEFWEQTPDLPPEPRKKRAKKPDRAPVVALEKLNGIDPNGNVGEIVAPEFADDELALKFSARFGQALRFVASWGRWMAWDGALWRHDDTLRVYDLARGMCRQAASEAGVPGLAAKLASGRTIAAVEKLARSDRRHAATAQQWDSDPWLLNTPKGVIDLHSGELRPARPVDHMTKSAATTPFGECPMWRRFLGEVTGGDTELQFYLQRIAGYSLTGSVREQALFFAYGTGGNGKGTFLNTLQSIMGDYAVVASAETFTSSAQSRHLTELARLQGARLVVAQETEEGKQLAEARVKAITGGDPITANFMRQDPFTFFPQFKLFISGNHKPALRNVDDAIRRRFNMVPFEVKIRNPNPDLFTQLTAEWPGILQWAVEGCLLWQEAGLAPPAAVRDATAEYFDAEDATATWLEQCCRVGSDRYARSGELFKSWEKWARGAGELPGSQKRFSQALISRGFKVRKTGGYPTFEGIEVVYPRSVYEAEEA